MTEHYKGIAFPDEKFYKNDLVDFKPIEEGSVTLTGVLLEGASFNHSVCMESFYRVRIQLENETVTLIVPEKILKTMRPHTGEFVSVTGKIMSKGRAESCTVYVVAKSISLAKKKVFHNVAKVEGFAVASAAKNDDGISLTIKIPHYSGINDLIPCVCKDDGLLPRFYRIREGKRIRAAGKLTQGRCGYYISVSQIA